MTFLNPTFGGALRCLCMLALGTSLAGPAVADIRIGVAQALSGPAAQYGVPAKNGFVLAAEQINARGGINGQKLELIIEDEQGKKEEALNVYKKLIFKDRVLMIFGPTLSNSAFAADPLANHAKVVAFGTSNTANGITDIGPYIFRNSVMESDVLPHTVRAAVKRFKVRRVAVIYGNDDAFTKSGYDVFKTVLAAQKIEVSHTETYAKGDVDFKAQLTKIKGGNPDAIVCSCLAEEAANIILQARGLGIKVPFIGGNGFNSPKLFEIARQAANDTLMGSPWSADNRTPANVAFMADYQKKYGTPADQFAAQAYDAVQIAAAALKKIRISGNPAVDRQALRDALPGVQLDGATGPFKFRPAAAKGGKAGGFDADQAAIVNIAENGRFILLK